MKAKPRAKQQETFAQGEDRSASLDESSVEAILGESGAGESDAGKRAADREPTIDELLAEEPARADNSEEPLDLDDTGRFEAADVLLPPELMFPTQPNGDEDG